MAARTIIGAAGSTLSDRDIARMARGGDVVLDVAASERLKKDSPPKGSTSAASSADVAAAANDGAAWLTVSKTRAVLLARLLPLVNGSSKTRLGVIELIARILRSEPHLEELLPAAADAVAMQRLAVVLPQRAAAATDASALTTAERAVVDSSGLTADECRALAIGQSAAVGLAAVAIADMRQLLTATSAVMALSAEALQADVRYSCCMQHDLCRSGLSALVLNHAAGACACPAPTVHAEPHVRHKYLRQTTLRARAGQSSGAGLAGTGAIQVKSGCS
jgi:hypothetical protein